MKKEKIVKRNARNAARTARTQGRATISEPTTAPPRLEMTDQCKSCIRWIRGPGVWINFNNKRFINDRE